MINIQNIHSIQNNLNGYKHITDKYFPNLGEHLWRKFTEVYKYNLLDFYNYLDLENKHRFKVMVKECFDINLI
jgi:hypothetical protein